MNSPQLLTDYEKCPRKAKWSRFEPHRISGVQMVTLAIKDAIRLPGAQDVGDYAGSVVMDLGQNRGIDTEGNQVYSEVIHHAALADILVSSIRKSGDSAWIDPPEVQNWTPDCLMAPSGDYLRRIVLVSHWTDERHYAECRSWFTLGEIVHYEMPMQLVVFVIGQRRGQKRHSPWTTGVLHPSGNGMLRFRKKGRQTEAFKESWKRIWREDYDNISREKWLQAMLTDDVLPEVLFKVEVPVPPAKIMQDLRDLAQRKLEAISNLKELPDKNLSTCDWPVECQFKRLCHNLPERVPSEKNGFIRTEPRTP